MADKQFDEAKLLYELLTKSRQSVKKESLTKLIPLLGFSTNANKLLARLERLKKGMPAEDEFMALAVWMEKCKLIHKLEQEQFPASSLDKYQVPDLLAVFDYDGKEIPVLIDVKAPEKETLPHGKFRLSARLYDKLTNYANLVGLPLLIAWKLSGYWTLFDIREMQKHESAYHIDWSGAMSADLMFLLLDSVHVTPMPGVSFTYILEDLGPTGHKTKGGTEHTAKYHRIRFIGADGNPVTKISWPQFILWMSADHEEKQSRHDNLLEITFEVPEEPSGLPTFALLPVMLFQMTSKEKRPKNWYDVVKSSRYGPITYSQFKKAMDDGIGTFIQYVLKIVPHKYPDFLPPKKLGDDS